MAGPADPEPRQAWTRPFARAAAGAALVLVAGCGEGHADPPRRAVPPGCFQGRVAATLSGELDAQGDLVLADGGRARLAGLAPAAGDGERQVAASLLQAPQRRAVVAGTADRWGRVPVEVVAGGTHVGAWLVKEGRALVLPGDLPAPCTRALLALEEQARRAGRGRWAGAGGILDAADGAGLAAHEGEFVLAEGRVSGIGRTNARFYLNFGTFRQGGLAIVVPNRALQKIEASGMRLASLEGRRIRVRGILVEEGGPRIEVTLPEQIEPVDEGPPRF